MRRWADEAQVEAQREQESQPEQDEWGYGYTDYPAEASADSTGPQPPPQPASPADSLNRLATAMVIQALVQSSQVTDADLLAPPPYMTEEEAN